MKENTIKTLLISEEEIKEIILNCLREFDDYDNFDNMHIVINTNKMTDVIEAVITMSKDDSFSIK